MKLIYDNKEILLIDCISFWQRFKGFMFQKKIDHAILFNNCTSIHTFFMKENIDVIICDKFNVIKYYYKNLKKGKIILPKLDGYKTIELPCNYFNFSVGKKVIIKN